MPLGKLPGVTQPGLALTSLLKLPQMCSSLSGTPWSQPGTPVLQGTILHHSSFALPVSSCSPTRLGSWDKGELSGNWRTSAMRAGEELWDSAGWGPKGWEELGLWQISTLASVRPGPSTSEPGPGQAWLRLSRHSLTLRASHPLKPEGLPSHTPHPTAQACIATASSLQFLAALPISQRPSILVNPSPLLSTGH